MKFKFWFRGNPIPKGRPRYARDHFYTYAPTADWEEMVGWQARDQFKRRPLLGPLGIGFIFYREDRRKVDLDNLEKAMLDGLQGVFFEDDSQIKEKTGKVLYDKERPGVEVTIWQL